MAKKLFTILSNNLILAIIAACILIIPAGCNNGSSLGSSTNTPLPGISNFSIPATTSFAKGYRATVIVTSSTLGDGLFTVLYNLSGSNTISSGATLTMSKGVGSFLTTVLESDGPTAITVTGVIYTSDTLYPTANNTSSMFDSTGMMTATYTPHGGSPVSFSATDVTATLTGAALNIQGIAWQTNLTTTVSLNNNIYNGTTGTAYFNANGNAGYAESGSATINDASAHGSVTIAAVSPLLTGSFTYKNTDSSIVAGTFSCPVPN